MATPKRDVLRTQLALHYAETKVDRLAAQLCEAKAELKWAQIAAKAARLLLASTHLIDSSNDRRPPS